MGGFVEINSVLIFSLESGIYETQENKIFWIMNFITLTLQVSKPLLIWLVLKHRKHQSGSAPENRNALTVCKYGAMVFPEICVAAAQYLAQEH